jgi:hypothetical protein
MKGLTFPIFFIVLFAACLPISSFAQRLGAYPTTLDFKLGNGQSEAQAINITNGSDKKVQFRLYLNDWIRDSTGGHVYFEPNTVSRSCSRWITLSKNFVELDPGQSTQVTVRLSIPDSSQATSEMKWSMLFIETVQEQTATNNKAAQATVRNLLRIGVHIYQTPPTLTQKEVKIYDLKPAADTLPNVYNLLCQNTGEIMLECKSYLEVTSLSDGKKVKLEALEFPLFPEQRRYVRYDLPKTLSKGKYSVLGVIDGGEDMSLEAMESTIDIK